MGLGHVMDVSVWLLGILGGMQLPPLLAGILFECVPASFPLPAPPSLIVFRTCLALQAPLRRRKEEVTGKFKGVWCNWKLLRVLLSRASGPGLLHG